MTLFYTIIIIEMHYICIDSKRYENVATVHTQIFKRRSLQNLKKKLRNYNKLKILMQYLKK